MVNGKVYVGQTSLTVSRRWTMHKYDSQKRDDCPIWRAIRKYGSESFEIRQIDSADTKKLINEREIFWIAFFSSYKSNVGYNATMGGDGYTPTPGNEGKALELALAASRSRTEESFRKMSESLKGHVRSEESKRKQSISMTGENNHFYGKKHTPETVRKIVESNLSRTVSSETRQKMSDARKGSNNSFYGKKHTKETLEKVALTKFLKTVAWG